MTFLEPAGEAHAELMIRRSRFVGAATPVRTPVEAHAAIDSVRALHQKASHVAYAFLLGDENTETAGMSDAGEPKGTAGRPMLAILRGSTIRDVVVTVSRYFGGVKLGTGGLVRAYGDTVRAVLESLPTRSRVPRSQHTIEVSYELIDLIKSRLDMDGVKINRENYSTGVLLELTIDDDLSDKVQTLLSDLSRGQIELNRLGSESPNPTEP